MGRVDCKSIGELCSKLAEHALPAWIYIRKDGAFERHYSKSNVHDLSQFIEVVSKSSLLAVLDNYFNNNVINSKDQNIIWVVDFFSPACTPCM
ncbi:hypothetical protein A3Q56_03192 [Intoshia linei]|uniref:Thioredoxin domain-containing protein n=1 Tax=Intoshia linei TaxID=1819745 RepID=A0A177B463_9BILA|nr:hypothetical protein A3Q56_03192 [Intoshia linei]